MTITLIKLMIVLLVIKAVDLLGRHYNKEPPKGATKGFLGATKPAKGWKDILEDELVMPLARSLALWIKMDERLISEWKFKLARAGMAWTPEEYFSRAIVITGMMMAAVMVGAYLGGLYAFLPFGICAAVVLGYHQFTLCADVLKKKKAKIAKGLPNFIRAILFKLREAQGSPDLIGIFELYLEVADPALNYDVSLLVMDMKSKSTEAALRSFSNRVALPEVDHLSRTLIGVTRGEDQALALHNMANDMDLRAKENLRKELEKRPGKVAVATMPLVGVAVIAMLYVIIASIGSGLTRMI